MISFEILTLFRTTSTKTTKPPGLSFGQLDEKILLFQKFAGDVKQN